MNNKQPIAYKWVSKKDWSVVFTELYSKPSDFPEWVITPLTDAAYTNRLETVLQKTKKCLLRHIEHETNNRLGYVQEAIDYIDDVIASVKGGAA